MNGLTWFKGRVKTRIICLRPQLILGLQHNPHDEKLRGNELDGAASSKISAFLHLPEYFRVAFNQTILVYSDLEDKCLFSDITILL